MFRRSACFHHSLSLIEVAIPVDWAALNNTAKAVATTYLRNTIVPALQSLAPDSGAYINEADPSDPNWQPNYYGSNYARLLEIKKQWDPKGVFWCKPCVGHELWEWVNGPKDEDPLEWGIGQGVGKICSK